MFGGWTLMTISCRKLFENRSLFPTHTMILCTVPISRYCCSAHNCVIGVPVFGPLSSIIVSVSLPDRYAQLWLLYGDNSNGRKQRNWSLMMNFINDPNVLVHVARKWETLWTVTETLNLHETLWVLCFWSIYRIWWTRTILFPKSHPCSILRAFHFHATNRIPRAIGTQGTRITTSGRDSMFASMVRASEVQGQNIVTVTGKLLTDTRG